MTENTYLQELILKNRSYRRFYEEIKISTENLTSFINLARLSPSARNAQSLKYIISNDAQKNATIFPWLAWAGYLNNWSGPVEGERPSAYIIVCNDQNLSQNYFCDHGIATQSILLGAVEAGFGGCIIGSVFKKELINALKIPENLEVLHVIALGKPKEIVIIEELEQDGDSRYWRDSEQKHHVPKRKLDDLIINL